MIPRQATLGLGAGIWIAGFMAAAIGDLATTGFAFVIGALLIGGAVRRARS